MAATSALRLSGVEKKYSSVSGESVLALSDASLSIEPGEFVSIVGPSGCGKTTLMKICAGLIKETRGTISYGDKTGALTPGSFGMVFQSPALLPWRNVRKNITLPVEVVGTKMSRADIRARVDELLHRVQLDDFGDKYPSELSGGMQQRVALCRSLILGPSTLFMDEPFGALDAMTRETMNRLCETLQMIERNQVIFVTHDVREAAFLADRVVVMSSRPGHIVGEVRIDLPRPRPIDDPALQVAEHHIREMLEGRFTSEGRTVSHG